MHKDQSRELETVTFVLPSLGIGGTERQIVNTLNQLSRSHWREQYRFDLVLLTKIDDLSDQLDTDITVNVVSPSTKISPLTPIRLNKYLNKTKPRVVYSLLAPANFMTGLLSFRRTKSKYVWGIRSSKHTIGIRLLRKYTHD